MAVRWERRNKAMKEGTWGEEPRLVGLGGWRAGERGLLFRQIKEPIKTYLTAENQQTTELAGGLGGPTRSSTDRSGRLGVFCFPNRAGLGILIPTSGCHWEAQQPHARSIGSSRMLMSMCRHISNTTFLHGPQGSKRNKMDCLFQPGKGWPKIEKKTYVTRDKNRMRSQHVSNWAGG